MNFGTELFMNYISSQMDNDTDEHQLVFTYKINECKNTKTDNDVVCGICLNNDLTTYVAPLCGHCFHEKCISQWLKDNNTCPTCRKVIRKTVTKTFNLTTDSISNFNSRSFRKINGYENVDAIQIENINEPYTDISACMHCDTEIIDKIYIMDESKFYCKDCAIYGGYLTNTINLCGAFTVSSPLPKKLTSIDFGNNITIDVKLPSNLQNIKAYKCAFTQDVVIKNANEISLSKCLFDKDVSIKGGKTIRINDCQFKNADCLATMFNNLPPEMDCLNVVIVKSQTPIDLFRHQDLNNHICFINMLKNIQNIQISVNKLLHLNFTPEFNQATTIIFNNIAFKQFPKFNSNVETLSIRRVTLKQTDTLDLGNFYKLKKLNLENTWIDNIILPTNDVLEFVCINKCKLSKITDIPSNIKFISLSKNRLITIPSIEFLDNCNVIDLSYNKLTNISKLSPNVSMFNASYNKLKTINLSNSHKIQVLCLSNNLLENFLYDSHINIAMILLYNNRLKTFNITSSDGGFTAIDELNVSGNKLKELNMSLNVKITILHIKNNKLLENINVNLGHIESLNIKNSKKLNKLAISCPFMHYLNIQNTMITKIETRMQLNVLKFKMNEHISNKIIKASYNNHDSFIIFSPRVQVTTFNMDKAVEDDDELLFDIVHGDDESEEDSDDEYSCDCDEESDDEIE